MKIEAGKFYRTKGGAKARVYALDGCGEYPVHAAVMARCDKWFPVTLDEFGQGGSGSLDSIISEWVENPPQFDWGRAAAWHNFIVLTRSGGWIALRNRPTISSAGDAWVVEGGANYIDEEFCPTFSGDWKDSLIERPTA